ncbi:MAG: hypothetical protein FJ095_20660 [Deltaproteobacteria bacterium]|nr:hypothetical protein [Deltaproteobacteria bacterium]
MWADGLPETSGTDHWRCRCESSTPGKPVSVLHVLRLIPRMTNTGFDLVKTEHLFLFDGKPAYSLGQGR